MGVDLRGGGEHYREQHFGWPAWFYCLAVADAFGWQREGTRPAVWCNADGSPCEEMNSLVGWSGSYSSNDHQTVTDSDARALAAALDRAIDALLSHAQVSREQLMALAGRESLPPSWNERTELLAQSMDATMHTPSFAFDAMLLGVLADFARQGGFSIA
jgi:hypothetical protein